MGGLAEIGGGGVPATGATVVLAGDAVGNSASNTVVRIRNNPVGAGVLGPGDAGKFLRWDGVEWAAAAVAIPGLTVTGELAALTAPNTFVSRLAAGLTAHDGTEASAAALLGGGMCVVGGAAAAIVEYYPPGRLAPVGATGWTQDVPLFPNAVGGMVPRGDATLTGIFSRECGVYDGVYLAVSIGQVEGF